MDSTAEDDGDRRRPTLQLIKNPCDFLIQELPKIRSLAESEFSFARVMDPDPAVLK